ncbi:MAG: hypothetical protein WC211_08335 [Dehalococcoidia bacterium]
MGGTEVETLVGTAVGVGDVAVGVAVDAGVADGVDVVGTVELDEHQ